MNKPAFIVLFLTVLTALAVGLVLTANSDYMAKMWDVEIVRQQAEIAQANAMEAQAAAMAAQAQAVKRQADASIAQSNAIETVAWTGYLTTSTVVVLGIVGMILGIVVMVLGALVVQSWAVRPRYGDQRPTPSRPMVYIVAGDDTIRHPPPPNGTVAYRHYMQCQEQGAYSEVIDG